MPVSRNRKKKKYSIATTKNSPTMAKQDEPIQHQQEIQKITGKFYKGMIPSPEMMEEYKQIDPDLPMRLVKWTEDESNHRRKIEKKITMHAFLTTIWGNIFGFFSLLIMGVLAYLFMINGHPIEGKWIALSTAGVIGIFVIRKYFIKTKE